MRAASGLSSGIALLFIALAVPNAALADQGGVAFWFSGHGRSGTTSPGRPAWRPGEIEALK